MLGTPDADLVLMTGNVAQVFLDESDWDSTLRSIHAALRPGGYLSFESRNPEARAWEGWTREASYERSNTVHGSMACWLELIRVSEGKVHFQAHNVFNDTGEVLVVDSTLRFRTLEEISTSLQETGFTVSHVYGGWHREPVTNNSRVMVFIAQRKLP